ncbi:sugar ABC transporter substrate-binding protein, partial [Rhizobium sp. Pop5]
FQRAASAVSGPDGGIGTRRLTESLSPGRPFSRRARTSWFFLYPIIEEHLGHTVQRRNVMTHRIKRILAGASALLALAAASPSQAETTLSFLIDNNPDTVAAA